MRALAIVAMVCSMGLSAMGEESGMPALGAVVFETGFETPAERQMLPSRDFAEWVPGYEGTQSLQVTVAPEEAAGHMVSMPIDLTPYRGCRLFLECMAKAENVTKPSQPYLGVKFMLHYASEAEGDFFDNENGVHGTFDWRPAGFVAHIAPDAEDGALFFGLQDSSGTVWFDNVRITVAGRPVVRPRPPVNPPPPFRGHGLPRLRGAMSSQHLEDEDLRVFGQKWGANVIRWQLTRNWGRSGTDRDLTDYDQWLEEKLARLDEVLEVCARYGIKVVVDLHSPPGGRYANSDLAIFNEPEYQAHFIAVWERMARRYKGHPAIWGYDLINEPVQTRPSPPGVANYLDAQVLAARAIRAIDPDTPIFIAAAQWDSPPGFEELMPVDVPNVIYQVHMYTPHEFTHQGVYNEWKPTAYPGEIGGKTWNKDQLRKVLEPVRTFQQAYNVHIYVGEFSAVRWAPGAAAYLRDSIDLFEEYGWDWTYHAFREWDGWSLEHGPDPEDHAPTAEPTDRMRLLLGWYGKNVPPPSAKD